MILQESQNLNMLRRNLWKGALLHVLTEFLTEKDSRNSLLFLLFTPVSKMFTYLDKMSVELSLKKIAEGNPKFRVTLIIVLDLFETFYISAMNIDHSSSFINKI